MSTILDRFTAAAPQVPIHPAGSAASSPHAAHPASSMSAAAAPPRTTGPLPPPAPCDCQTAPLDLFADPLDQTAQPRPCGCPLFWVDGFGNLHCQACRPPLRRAMARQRLSVVTTAVGYAWEDLESHERLTGDDGKPVAAPDPDADAHPVLVKLLDDDEMYWAIVQRRDRNSHIPIDMTLDQWWELNGNRQTEAIEARKIAEEYRKSGFSPSRPPENSPTKKAARKNSAAKKIASPEIFEHEEFFD